MKTKKKKIKNRYKSRYQAGGMYGSNTVSSAGQGTASTSNIVYEESNPAILEEKLKAAQANKEVLMQKSEDMSSKVNQMDAQSKLDIVNAKQQEEAKFTAGESVVKSGLKAIKTGIDLTKPKDKTPVKNPYDANIVSATTKAASTADDFATAVPGSNLGTPLNVPAQGGSMDVLKSFSSPAPMSPSTMAIDGVNTTGVRQSLDINKSLQPGYVPPTSNIPVSTAAPIYDLGKATVDGKAVGKGIGAGIKAFKAQRATNQAIKSGKLLASSAGSATKAGFSAMSAGAKGNLIGAGASLLGSGIKKIGGDDDDTELNAAEWSGDLLSGAGTGIGVASTLGTIGGAIGLGSLWGSAVPGLGTAIGAVAGLGYGAWKALSGRKKARKAEEAYKAERKKKIAKFNKEAATSILSQKIRTNQARLASKKYSGYDLGTNYRDRMAQMGGMRMGMPRYGYAA